MLRNNKIFSGRSRMLAASLEENFATPSVPPKLDLMTSIELFFSHKLLPSILKHESLATFLVFQHEFFIYFSSLIHVKYFEMDTFFHLFTRPKSKQTMLILVENDHFTLTIICVTLGELLFAQNMNKIAHDLLISSRRRRRLQVCVDLVWTVIPTQYIHQSRYYFPGI